MNKAITKAILSKVNSTNYCVPAFSFLIPLDWNILTTDDDTGPSRNAGPREVCRTPGKGVFQCSLAMSLSDELEGMPSGFAKVRFHVDPYSRN